MQHGRFDTVPPLIRSAYRPLSPPPVVLDLSPGSGVGPPVDFYRKWVKDLNVRKFAIEFFRESQKAN
jgi:hypothetical protein